MQGSCGAKQGAADNAGTGRGVVGGEHREPAVVAVDGAWVRRGDAPRLATHQRIAFDTRGVLVDGQHWPAAVIEADLPVEMTVFSEVEPDTFDVLATDRPGRGAATRGKRIIRQLGLAVVVVHVEWVL